MNPDNSDSNKDMARNQAIDNARNSLGHIFDDNLGTPQADLQTLPGEITEPTAKAEIQEVEELTEDHQIMSKHQLFMKELVDSGRDSASIQTEWHKYYEGLPPHEKHEVWQEFYDERNREKQIKKQSEIAHKIAEPEVEEEKPVAEQIATFQAQTQAEAIVSLPNPKNQTLTANETEGPLPSYITNSKVFQARKRFKTLSPNHHVRSLAFGFGMGFMVIFFLLFSFFNERFITPFIRPNTNVSATPIIVDTTSNAPVGPEPKIIIPKINLEAPVVYDVKTIEEDAIQEGLERGVVHYSTTPNPGELGNSVIFGHSSGNILNKGKYKFAFILLKSLDEGDTFIIHKDKQRYVYKVFNKYVTTPDDISVLQPGQKPAMMTLITCDPPGTSTNRLIVQAEQIFPSPSTNKKSSVPASTVSEPEKLPSDSKTLWQRLFGG